MVPGCGSRSDQDKGIGYYAKKQEQPATAQQEREWQASDKSLQGLCHL